MNIQFDSISTKKFFEWIASKFLEITLPIIERKLSENQDEELLNRNEVSKRIFKCDVKTFDEHYRYASGFPKIVKEGKEKYPKKLVEKWIHENTQY
ncbi:TPA: hypothetical protein ACOW36_001732 [Enterococcus faecalis]|uniref:hypothetical protein n=1 Tax=Enterococcus faecalis TaxID=1351 RepID=UPI003B868D9B